MESNREKVKNVSYNKEKAFKDRKMKSYLTTFGYMLIGMLVIFSYVYQSTKQVYLNYEIVNLNKEVSNLNIKLAESKVENERLQTNENIEKLAAEKLGMSYEKSDRVVVIKETDEKSSQQHDDDKRKIKIFMKSLYEETNKQLSQFSVENLVNYFKS